MVQIREVRNRKFSQIKNEECGLLNFKLSKILSCVPAVPISGDRVVKQGEEASRHDYDEETVHGFLSTQLCCS